MNLNYIIIKNTESTQKANDCYIMSTVEKKFLLWQMKCGGSEQLKTVEDFFEEESGRNSFRFQIMSETL